MFVTQRVRLAVAAKGIPHESVYIHLERKPSWFLQINGNGLVPVVDHNQKIVRESQVCFGKCISQRRLFKLPNVFIL